MDDIIRVPIIKDFDYENVIGELSIKRSELPPTHEFFFSIGYRLMVDSSSYQLLCVSPVYHVPFENSK